MGDIIMFQRGYDAAFYTYLCLSKPERYASAGALLVSCPVDGPDVQVWVDGWTVGCKDVNSVYFVKN